MSPLHIINFYFVRCLKLSPLHVMKIRQMRLGVIFSLCYQLMQLVFSDKKTVLYLFWCLLEVVLSSRYKFLLFEVLGVVLSPRHQNLFYEAESYFPSSRHQLTQPVLFDKKSESHWFWCLHRLVSSLHHQFLFEVLEIFPSSRHQNLPNGAWGHFKVINPFSQCSLTKDGAILSIIFAWSCPHFTP